MTSEPASQSMQAGRTDDIPASWDERTTVTTLLDYARDTVHAKCTGLTEDDHDREFRIATGIPLTQLLADYRAACARHTDLVAALDLDTPPAGDLGWRTEPVTLRWILLHLTEETARHNGHIDILRELADGTRGR